MNQFRRVRLFGGFALALALAMTWQQSVSARADQEPWGPVLDSPIHLVRPYMQPSSDYSAGHRGIDYRAVDGAAIYSPTDAVIYFNENLVDRPVLSLKTQNGDLIEFEPACGLYPVGTAVALSEKIGIRCSASAGYKQHCPDCLHYSLRTERGYLSPIVRTGALAPSVLLPLR